MELPTQAVLNVVLTQAVSRPVIKFEVIPISDNEVLTLRFVAKSGGWRQGIWLGAVGELDVGGVHGEQFELWMDTAPPAINIQVLQTKDGLLRFYNIWDSGRGRRRESQSATAGMVLDEIPGGTRYMCNDIGHSPAFDKLTFDVTRQTL